MAYTSMTASERLYANSDCWNVIMRMKRELELELERLENECLYEEYIYQQKCAELESYDGFYQREDKDYDESGILELQLLLGVSPLSVS